MIAAICRREDVRDALVSRGGLELDQLPRGARVGTSSLRRQAQLRARRPDLEMAEIRGNVDTRLAKLDRGEFDAIVLAKAGLERLGLAGRITEMLSTDICLPAAGQGAIGIETRAIDQSALSAVADTRIMMRLAWLWTRSARCWLDSKAVVRCRSGSGRA